MVRVRLFAFDPEHGHDVVLDVASMPATWWSTQAARTVWRGIEHGDIPAHGLSRGCAVAAPTSRGRRDAYRC